MFRLDGGVEPLGRGAIGSAQRDMVEHALLLVLGRLVAALGLILDGVMTIWPRGDKATEYKQ